MTIRATRARCWTAALLSLVALPLWAAASQAEGTFDIPPGATFSQEKLAKIGEFFENEIAAKKIPGAVFMIRQGGKAIYHKHFGVRTVESKIPMSDDTIFRIHSMSKPITSVAAMMLIERGKLKLDDPVAKYIPSFGNMKVGVEKKSESGDKTLDLVPLARPMTIRDLMLHTSGIPYGFYGDSLVRKAYGDAKIYSGDFSNAEFAERIAKLPLEQQPGTLWNYGHSTDILGRVIEVVSGQSLLKFEQDNLLTPLGMTDTNFFLDDATDLKRAAQPVPNDADFKVGFSSTDVFRKWESGGGGMLSTPADFARFAQMILNGGTLDGKTYLDAKTFAEMTTDHIGPTSGVKRDYLYFPGDGFGFGLGFGVRTDPGNAKPPPPGSLGELKWDGASGCYFVVDRKQDFFFLLMEQSPTERQRIQQTVKRLVYEALEK